MKKSNTNLTSDYLIEEPLALSIVDVVEGFITSRGYETRYNEVSGKVEMRKGNKEFKAMTDRDINSLHREILRERILCSLSMLKGILFSDFSELYNPFKEYFSSLPKWDQTTDYIQELAQTIHTTNQDLWYKCFRKWIVAMTGSLIVDEVVNHSALIFSGKQGIGKTTWITKLVPETLKHYYYSGKINPNNKDTLIYVGESPLINMDELEAMSKSEIEALKELITKPSIRVRRPYAVNPEFIPHRASFAGSVNSSQFLIDSENRRFACFEVLSIDYKHQILMDNVFSQALHLFNTGFQFWFDSNEIELLAKNNEQFREMSLEEEILLTWFEACQSGEATHHLTTTEIEGFLVGKTTLKSSESTRNKLGKALRKHRFKRLKKDGRYVYALKKIK